jgi:hypothetical protein
VETLILDLLERREDGLPIEGNALVIDRLGLRPLGSSQSAIKNSLGEIGR